MEYYSAIRRDEILPFATTWMNLELIMQSEINQTEKVENHIIVTYMSVSYTHLTLPTKRIV